MLALGCTSQITIAALAWIDDSISTALYKANAPAAVTTEAIPVVAFFRAKP